MVLWNHSSGQFPKAAAWAPTSVRFAARNVWIVEVFTKDPYRGIGKEVLFIDKETMLPAYKIVYNLEGDYVKTVIAGWSIAATKDKSLVYNWTEDLVLGDICEKNSQLRPHIVWFGEEVPKMQEAAEITSSADILIIIGTSMHVYPAASLIDYIQEDVPIYFIDPLPTISENSFSNLTIIREIASRGTGKLMKLLNVENS